MSARIGVDFALARHDPAAFSSVGRHPLDDVTFEAHKALRARQDALFSRQMGWWPRPPYYGQGFAANGVDAGD